MPSIKRLLLLVLLGCLAPFVAHAAFPTSAVLDTFTRGDNVDMGTSWTPTVISGQVLCWIVGNAGGTSDGAACSEYWNPGTFGPDVEAYGTINNEVQGDWIDIYVRLQSVGTAGVDGYKVRAELDANTLSIWRVTDGTPTQLGSDVSRTWANGDAFGIEVTGTGATVTIKSYYKPSAGSWTLGDTQSDTNAARITAAGNVGIGLKGLAGGGGLQLDNFGGGTLAAGAACAPSRVLLGVGC